MIQIPSLIVLKVVKLDDFGSTLARVGNDYLPPFL